VPFWPDAAWRDVVFGVRDDRRDRLLALGRRPAELDKPPDPSSLDADPRPDWYLLWYFAVLALIPPSLETVRHPRARSSSARSCFSVPSCPTRASAARGDGPGRSAWWS
jgi:hypothetical protein